MSEMAKAIRSLETARNARKMLPSFYDRGLGKRKNIAWCMHGVPTELLMAFDIEAEWPENFGAFCASQLVAQKFIAIAEQEGYTGDLCAYLTNTMGYCSRSKDVGGVAPESPYPGGMGEPVVLLGSGYLCDPRYKWFQAIATRYINVPIFNSDPMSPPYDIDIKDERIKEHYLEQLRQDIWGQIVFLEEKLGKKFDVTRFRRIMEISQESLYYWCKSLELRKAKPCPMGAADYFTCIIPQLFMLGKEEGLEFYKALYVEMKERVANGQGVVKNEKYRMYFAGIPPYFNLGMFNYLEKLGAVSVFESVYYPGPFVDVDLKDPVEGLVQRIWERASWYHECRTEAMPEICNPGIMLGVGSKFLLELVDEYEIDGAVMHRTHSCRAISWGQVHYKNLLEKADVPALVFESDMADPRKWSDARFKAQIEPFIEMMEYRKYKKMQKKSNSQEI